MSGGRCVEKGRKEGEGKWREERGTKPETDKRPTRQGDRQTRGEPHHTGKEGQQAKSYREEDRRMWRLALVVIIIF